MVRASKFDFSLLYWEWKDQVLKRKRFDSCRKIVTAEKGENMMRVWRLGDEEYGWYPVTLGFLLIDAATSRVKYMTR